VTVLRRVWLVTLAYWIVYAALGTDRYVTYRSGADLGLFTQTIASSLHGFANTVEGGNHFAFHFSPILYACAPALWLLHSPLALVLIQACACALAVPPLFLLARRRLPERFAFAVAAIALVYPPLAGVAFSDFHENGFVPAATLWLLWAVDARRWRLACAFLAVTLAIKEDQAPILVFGAIVALAYFARRRERDGVRFALGALAASVAVFVAFFAIVRPLAAGGHGWEPLHFYARAAIEHGTRKPLVERLTYALEAFVPLCFACFASPVLLLALPGFAELFLSRDPVTYTMGQHYAAVWIPYVLAAYAFGVARIAERRQTLAARLVQISLALCVLNLLFASPTHWGHYLGPRTAHDATLDRFLSDLPPDLQVGTHDEIYAHIGFDPHASIGLSSAPAFALFDGTMATSYWVERTRDALSDPSGRYALVRDDDGIGLYRRKKSAAAQD